MTTTLLQIQRPYYSPSGLINPGELIGVDAATAADLVAAGTAVEYDAGSGAGVPTASPFRGIGEAETPAQYAAAGGTLGDQKTSAAIQGFLGGDSVTIVDGRSVPNSEASWA
jgi:hypothetical protein